MKFLEVFFTAFKLGLTSFGGPMAHLGYFHHEYVKKKKWMSEEAYADLVVLCQFLPGPASSQVGMAIGLSSAGVIGAILSWIGFTLPSAMILILFGLGAANIDLASHQHWLHGLKVVAVAVVAQAVYGMSKKLCPDKERKMIALISALAILFSNTALTQIIVLIFAGVVGTLFIKPITDLPHEPIHRGSKSVGAFCLVLFFGLLVFLPVLSGINPDQGLKLFDSFYRAGALVFGGGHVVLPMLQAEVVPTGWVNQDLFMAGYGLANAIPGPLFAFTGFLGAASSKAPNGLSGALLCLIAAFLPSFLLILGVLPFWEQLRSLTKIRQAILALNASVVGILLAALYHPVWTSAIFTAKDFIIASAGFIMLEFFKLPSWFVVFISVLTFLVLP